MRRLPVLIGWLAACLSRARSQSTQPAPAASTLHSSTSAPLDVNHLRCIFCENVQSNHNCNRFAIDRPCPAGTTFCRTLHIMDGEGRTLVVNKHCATERQCRLETVGCLQEDHQKTCVSCCHSSFCNRPVPTNHSNAVLEIKPTAPTQAVKSSGARRWTPLARWPLTLLFLAALDVG